MPECGHCGIEWQLPMIKGRFSRKVCPFCMLDEWSRSRSPFHASVSDSTLRKFVLVMLMCREECEDKGIVADYGDTMARLYESKDSDDRMKAARVKWRVKARVDEEDAGE